MEKPAMVKRHAMPADPLWYKDAVFYEVRVRSYLDSNADGIGDFPGLTAKLDYIQDLGVTTLWLLPFYPSPIKDDGYDISDYTDVHPDCGTLYDFKVFLKEAHRRGLRVVTELVLNHTSDQHPWFQRARRAKPGTRERDYYVWSDTNARYREARIIFQDFERSNWTWDPAANAYYWHRFYSHQPDLNFDSPDVHKEIFKIVDFWLKLGVDGLRLDAVPYLYQREGTNCENLPETHAFLRDLRAHVDGKFKNRMLLAEANQWPEDAVAYMAEGKECQMAFHFPIMPRLFMALHMEDRFPIVDILAQTPALHESCQWVLFLRNHDELTLEMVTDEERDYMYEVYGREPSARINLGIRRRLAPLLENNRRKIELMNALLFSLPGTPVVYNGDEIGMGDNVYLGDRNGVRTPMQWSADRNAGFSLANPQRLILPIIIDPEYHYEAFNVDSQQRNPSSLLWWTKRAIALRKHFKSFGQGSLEFVNPDNPAVLAFIRQYQEERVLVVANLSRFVQFAELDLAKCRGLVPTEMFGRVPFPAIGDTRYFLSLGPHAFYWFTLEPPAPAAQSKPADTDQPAVLDIRLPWSWKQIEDGDGRRMFESLLPSYLTRSRWFGGKGRVVRNAVLRDVVPIHTGQDSDLEACLAIVEVTYRDQTSERYLLPLALLAGDRAAEVVRQNGWAILAETHAEKGQLSEKGVLADGTVDAGFCRALLGLMRRQSRNGRDEIVAGRSERLATLDVEGAMRLAPKLLRADQSNTCILFGDQLVLKIMRRVEAGKNPDMEIGQYLSSRGGFPHVPHLAGWLEYRADPGEPSTIGVVHDFVPNQGDAWQYTREEIKRFFERVLATPATSEVIPVPPALLVDLATETPHEQVTAHIGGFLASVRLLGRRTAELHLALAASSDDGDFSPESYTGLYQRAVYQSVRNIAAQALRQLKRKLNDIPEPARTEARSLVDHQDQIFAKLKDFTKQKVTVLRTRHHGDFHLGQVLYTGKDFVIIDFEGEPLRPLAERRRKRAAIRDVAGMLRSFDYAIESSLLEEAARGVVAEPSLAALTQWSHVWQAWVSAAFLDSYLKAAGSAPIVPATKQELQMLLDLFTLEKAMYELTYELSHRPTWLRIPLRGITRILSPRQKG
jgi:maltose alpha-D-glucosyltransferase / alpha-amylase